MRECPECNLTVLNRLAVICPRCGASFAQDGDEPSVDVSHIVNDDGELNLVILGDQTIEEVRLIMSLSSAASEMYVEDIPTVQQKDDYEEAMRALLNFIVKKRRQQIAALMRLP